MSAAEKWKLAPAAKRPIARRPLDRQTLLAHFPAEDRDGARGEVVVVEARVVVIHPADQPSGEMSLAEKLLVDALA